MEGQGVHCGIRVDGNLNLNSNSEVESGNFVAVEIEEQNVCVLLL